jgi:hypothetical protein
LSSNDNVDQGKKGVSKQAWKEFLGVAGVIASLIFVGVEIRQNTVAARAAAYQAMGEGISEFWSQVGQNPDQAVLLSRFFNEVDAEFTPTEEAMLVATHVAALRREETVWRQIELGLVGPEMLQHLGNNAPNGPGAAGNMARLWPKVAPLMSPDFRAHIEEAKGYSPLSP